MKAAVLSILIALAVALATARAEAGERGPVQVRLCPRSKWDPHQQYMAARVVATMPVRVCTEYDAEAATCSAEHMSWSVAVSRNEYMEAEIMQYAQITLERYGGSAPHLWELYHTTDNHTYVEQCTTERYFWPVPEASVDAHESDVKLVKMAQVWGMSHPSGQLVLRWGYGRLWPVPEANWTAGERALHTGIGVESAMQTDSPYNSPDIIPLHYELD